MGSGARLRKWGEPDRIIANEPEGRIYVYIKREEDSSRSSAELYRYGSGTRESDIPGDAAAPARVYIFWLDSNDIVYDWTVQEEIPRGTAIGSKRSHSAQYVRAFLNFSRAASVFRPDSGRSALGFFPAPAPPVFWRMTIQ